MGTKSEVDWSKNVANKGRQLDVQLHVGSVLQEGGLVGRSLTTRLNPLTGLRLDQCCSRATSYNPPHSSFSIFQIRNSHIEQTVVEKRSKRIYRTSKCFRHAIKHLGLCVKHTLTLRPRKFFSRVTSLAHQTSAHPSLAPNRQPVFIK